MTVRADCACSLPLTPTHLKKLLPSVNYQGRWKLAFGQKLLAPTPKLLASERKQTFHQTCLFIGLPMWFSW